nr:hypothetical protein [Anaeromonas gelatinilytica]
MPISTEQINFPDISTDFDKFYYQNNPNLLSLLNKFIDTWPPRELYTPGILLPVWFANSVIFVFSNIKAPLQCKFATM